MLEIEPDRVGGDCPVPVRATLISLEDRRATSAGPTFLGYQKTRYSLDLLYSARPLAELVRSALEKSFLRCASGATASTPALHIEVVLDTLVVFQEANPYPVKTGSRIDLSTRVLDAGNKEALDSFVVHVKNESIAEAGTQPDPKLVVEGLLDEATRKMMWQLVPAIRRRGG